MRSFNEISVFDFESALKNQVEKEIQAKSKSYLLGIDEQAYLQYLDQTFTLEELKVDIEGEEINEPRKTTREVSDRMYGRGSYKQEVYEFTVKYPFTGDARLFRVQPSHFIMNSYDIYPEESIGKVRLSFMVDQLDPEQFHQIRNDAFKRAFQNIDNVNQDLRRINTAVKAHIRSVLRTTKDKYLKENDFFKAINLKVNSDTSSVFTAPVVKKIDIPQPAVKSGTEFSSAPTLSKQIYEDVLKVIYDAGKNMERKPALYIGRDEEGLRDQFLFMLETRYEAVTATGETFNRGGKTDILLKYAPDGSNVFVAECKYWHGAAECQKAISQLFDRYLTWRDSKVALLFFVNNKDFTTTLKAAVEATKAHPYCLRSNGSRGESSFSFIFRLAQDRAKEVNVELMLFHYDKNN